jgi:hypothetical protein
VHIGIDFDNTMVCYDRLFHRLAADRGLIEANVPAGKTTVRNHLRRHGRNDVWTELQAEAYGARLGEAVPFPGLIAFLEAARDLGFPVSIISHKTLYPARGPKYDLHRAARDWLERHEITTGPRPLVFWNRVRFETSRESKAVAVTELGCTHFIDDLPEFLREPFFPLHVKKLLFDPAQLYAKTEDLPRFVSWQALQIHLLAPQIGR